ncbi:MAG: hypothetical protein SPL00_05050 [Bacilli bacterium]|nr:hypothetical protein [Bacilli bacterium]
MKKKILLGISCAALGLGIATGISFNHKEALTFDAIGSGDTLYVKINGNWAGQTDNTTTFIWAHCWGLDGDHDVRLSLHSGNVYSFTVPNCSSLNLARGNATEVIWDYSNNYALSSLTGGNNMLAVPDNVWKDFDPYVFGEYRPEKTAGNVYLRGSWSGGWADFSHPMNYVSTNVYSISNVSLSTGNKIKTIKIGNDYFVNWYDAAGIPEGDSEATFDGSDIVIAKNGIYNIQVNLDTKVYTINVSDDEDFHAALTFASDFATSMSSVCPEKGGSVGALSTAFSTFSSRYTNDLSEAARGYLSAASPTAADIVDFQKRYDFIINAYWSSLKNYDFLGRHSGANVINVLENPSNTFVVVISVISVFTLFTAGSYFFLRKKKENK